MRESKTLANGCEGIRELSEMSLVLVILVASFCGAGLGYLAARAFPAK